MQPGCIWLILFVLYALVVRECFYQASRRLVYVVYDFILVIHVVCCLVYGPRNSTQFWFEIAVTRYCWTIYFMVDLLSHGLARKDQTKCPTTKRPTRYFTDPHDMVSI